MTEHANLLAVWIGILLGFVAGAVQGLFFHSDAWLGGYGSWRRRMVRLGHISFFGLAQINLSYVLSVYLLEPENLGPWPGRLLIVGALAMPLICYLSAWRKPFRHLFPIPVGALAGWRRVVRVGGLRSMRIALIAMSGIRVCDEELLRLGLTLPGFVERSKVIASLPSLGLLTLAGMTPAEHEVAYFEVADLAESRAAGQLPSGFDLAAISSYSAQINEAYELADDLRKQGTPVVLGGLHVTSLPDEAALHADAVVVGEGELSWPSVLAGAQRGELQPVYTPNGAEFDLAQAPLPAYELLDIDQYNRLTVQTSRGCPHACEFCASSILLTRRYKQKPIARVLAEIERIRALWPRPFIEFADDNTFIDRAYWKELLPNLCDRRLRWFAETDISVSADAGLLDLMRAAGCAQVLIGLESPTPGPLAGIETRADWKHKQWPHYRDAVREIQAHGISVNGCFVIGLDGHGPEIFDEVFEFVREAELHEVQITLQTPFPGTPLHERLRAAGRLLHDGDWRRCTLFDVCFQPQGMSVAELEQGFRELGTRLYSEEFTDWRRRCFHKARRAARAEPEEN